MEAQITQASVSLLRSTDLTATPEQKPESLFRAHPRCQPVVTTRPRGQDMGFAAQATLYPPPWISAPSGHGVLTALRPQTLLPQAPRGPQSPTFNTDTMESPPLQTTLSCFPQPDSTPAS